MCPNWFDGNACSNEWSILSLRQRKRWRKAQLALQNRLQQCVPPDRIRSSLEADAAWQCLLLISSCRQKSFVWHTALARLCPPPPHGLRESKRNGSAPRVPRCAARRPQQNRSHSNFQLPALRHNSTTRFPATNSRTWKSSKWHFRRSCSQSTQVHGGRSMAARLPRFRPSAAWQLRMHVCARSSR